MIVNPKLAVAVIAVLSHTLASALALRRKAVVWSGEVAGTAVQELRGLGLAAAVRKCFKVAGLLLDLPMHIRVLRILSYAEVKAVKARDPLFTVKYLRTYLANSLSRGERARILISHYDYLRRRLDPRFLERIVNSPLVLWEEDLLGSRYRIYLTFPVSAHMEGDLALTFAQDSINLFTLSFTIGPGDIFNTPSEHVIYIARVQGKGGAIDRIRQATKNCHEVSPPALLLAAAQAIAMSLHIKELIGICAEEQISFSKSAAQESASLYDEFWISMGAERLKQRVFRLPVPLPEKPLSQIQRDHRRRVVRKRQFKHCVSDHVSRSFRESSLRTADPI